MLEKFKKNALSSEQMKNVKGGYVVSCVCDNGTAYGCSGTRDDLIACAKAYCDGYADCQHAQ
jgi:natural product precursor